MYEQEAADLRGQSRRPHQAPAIERRELGYPRVDGEALEPEYSCGMQSRTLVLIARHGPAPEPNVHVNLANGGRALDPQRLRVDGRGKRGQRPVGDRGEAPRRPR